MSNEVHISNKGHVQEFSNEARASLMKDPFEAINVKVAFQMQNMDESYVLSNTRIVFTSNRCNSLGDKI